MSDFGRLHVGLVGCGRWGRHILRDLALLGCSTTVVARSERARSEAAKRSSARVPSIGELPAVDGVVVATPTTTHAEVVGELLDLGVPIFVEKPFTSDPATAAELAAAAGDRLFVMDKWRYHPGVEELARMARREELGPVVGLATVRVGWGHPHPDVDAVWILAPHDLAIGLEVLGRLPEPRGAVADRVAGHATGLRAILGEEPWHHVEVGTRSPVRRRQVTLYGRDAVAVLTDSYSEHLEIYRPRDLTDTELVEPERRAVSAELPLLRELRAFLGHLAGGPPPRSSAAEGVAIVETIARLRAMAGLD